MRADPTAADLAPTEFVESEHPAVQAFARRATAGATSERQAVSQLVSAVRYGIRYDPFSVSRSATAHRASGVLAAGSSYCVPKSVLLAAGARALGGRSLAIGLVISVVIFRITWQSFQTVTSAPP